MKRDRKNRKNPEGNPYLQKQTPPPPKRNFIDFNTRRICPACGLDIKITHNFCKRCGVDLSRIEPIGKDEISKQLAITAVNDPDAGVRKEAVDTLGEFGDTKVLGVLTYVLLNDPDELVRKEAADELGDLHHPYSLNTLAKALKDVSPLVRKEAIEGLKKIKKKTKPEKQFKGKPEEREPFKAKVTEEKIQDDQEDFSV